MLNSLTSSSWPRSRRRPLAWTVPQPPAGADSPDVPHRPRHGADWRPDPWAAAAGDRDGDLAWLGMVILLAFGGVTLAFLVWLAWRLLG